MTITVLMQCLKNDLNRCEFKDNDEFHHSIDIYDASEDYPFCWIARNPKNSARFDVYRVDYCREYGHDIRDDKYEATECSLFAAVAIARRLHQKIRPEKYAYPIEVDEGKRRQAAAT